MNVRPDSNVMSTAVGLSPQTIARLDALAEDLAAAYALPLDEARRRVDAALRRGLTETEDETR